MFPTFYVTGSPPAPAGETFGFTASHFWNGANARYTGADPNDGIGAGGFGSIDPGTFTGGTIYALYAFAQTDSDANQIAVSFQLTSPADADAFESISWVGPDGLVTLNRADADDPDGYDNGGMNPQRSWDWSSLSGSFIATGQTYTVTVT